jgi:hypothetical protein
MSFRKVQTYGWLQESKTRLIKACESMSTSSAMYSRGPFHGQRPIARGGWWPHRRFCPITGGNATYGRAHPVIGGYGRTPHDHFWCVRMDTSWNRPSYIAPACRNGKERSVGRRSRVQRPAISPPEKRFRYHLRHTQAGRFQRPGRIPFPSPPRSSTQSGRRRARHHDVIDALGAVTRDTSPIGPT